MMKNMEWGAVAYLQHSKYGSHAKVRINNSESYVTGSSCSSEKCLISEKNLLGSSTENVIDYNNSASVHSSTTDNYYGIYDMAGGAVEYVMGVMLDADGKLVSGGTDNANSNFIGTLTYTSANNDPSKKSWTAEDGGLPWPSKRYYDTYEISSAEWQQYQRGILGDGTKEFGSFYIMNGTNYGVSEWYSSLSKMVYYGNPWFLRGGLYSEFTTANIESFDCGGGPAQPYRAFRVVLTP